MGPIRACKYALIRKFHNAANADEGTGSFVAHATFALFRTLLPILGGKLEMADVVHWHRNIDFSPTMAIHFDQLFSGIDNEFYSLLVGPGDA